MERRFFTAWSSVFTPPFARALAPFLELAIESARGREPFVTIAEDEPTKIVYEGRWVS